ncbi:hypothetical protein L208DRAFT_574226 [Tricholoma matsutake]|nr:hypothetical protein L208DRAFT_574226 [Tricholoma matsutake 945]
MQSAEREKTKVLLYLRIPFACFPTQVLVLATLGEWATDVVPSDRKGNNLEGEPPPPKATISSLSGAISVPPATYLTEVRSGASSVNSL